MGILPQGPLLDLHRSQPAHQLGQAGKLFGHSTLSELAKKADLPVDELKELLAKFLPVAVDRATPGGKL